MLDSRPLISLPSPRVKSVEEHDYHVPPHSLEAERAVLGGILRGYIHGDGTPHEKTRSTLKAADFYHKGHRLIFQAMSVLHSRSEPVDLITLPDALQGNGHLEAVGGVSYLSELLDATPTAGHVRHYSQIVKDRAALRGLRRAALGVLDLMDRQGSHGSDGSPLARATVWVKEPNEVCPKYPSRGGRGLV